MERMDYTHLGRSGLSVSRLCLGTMNFGPETAPMADADKALAVLTGLRELGVHIAVDDSGTGYSLGTTPVGSTYAGAAALSAESAECPDPDPSARRTRRTA